MSNDSTGEAADVLTTSNAPPPSDPPAAKTSRWPAFLIAVATVLTVVAATTTWVRTQLLDTDEWVDASSEILADSDVQEALSEYLIDELYTNVDVAAELESVLPEDLEGLAGPLAGALRAPASEATQQVLASDPVQQLWQQANRASHELFVAIVRDDTPDAVSASDGTVVLDLGEVVRNLGEQIGISDDTLDRIPDDVGQITIFESDELADLQDLVQVLDVLSWFLFVLVVLLYALAVYLARDRRREALRNAGLSVIGASVALWLLRAVAVRSAVDFYVEDPNNERAATVIANTATELVNQMAWSGLVLGAAIALYAAFIGPHAWAVAIRRRIGRFSDPTLVVAGAAVIVLVLLVWWSPGNVFERWVTALTMIGLVIAAAIGVAVSVRNDDEIPIPESSEVDDAGDDEPAPDLEPHEAADERAGSGLR